MKPATSPTRTCTLALAHCSKSAAVEEPRRTCTTHSALTLPSRGRPQSGFACLRPPLMSNVRPPSQSNATRAPITTDAHRTGAGVASSSGRSAEHDTRNRRSGLSVRKPAASERPHKLEAFLGQVTSRSPSLVRPGREDVGNVASSLRQSVNTKLKHSQAVRSRSRKHQSPAMRVGLARNHGQSAQVRVCALGYEGEIQLAVRARSVRSSRWPNPSIEGTHNGGAQLRAPSRSAAPLCAPHVKR